MQLALTVQCMCLHSQQIKLMLKTWRLKKNTQDTILVIWKIWLVTYLNVSQLIKNGGETGNYVLYSFRQVCGFFNVPCWPCNTEDAGDGAYSLWSPYPRRLECLTICWYNYKGSTFSTVILRPWVLVPSGARTLNLPHSRLALYQLIPKLSHEPESWPQFWNNTAPIGPILCTKLFSAIEFVLKNKLQCFLFFYVFNWSTFSLKVSDLQFTLWEFSLHRKTVHFIYIGVEVFIERYTSMRLSAITLFLCPIKKWHVTVVIKGFGLVQYFLCSSMPELLC